MVRTDSFQLSRMFAIPKSSIGPKIPKEKKGKKNRMYSFESINELLERSKKSVYKGKKTIGNNHYSCHKKCNMKSSKISSSVSFFVMKAEK